MERAIKAGKFLEHAHVHGNIYGTSWKAVENVRTKVCSLCMDVRVMGLCTGLCAVRP